MFGICSVVSLRLSLSFVNVCDRGTGEVIRVGSWHFECGFCHKSLFFSRSYFCFSSSLCLFGL